MSLSLNRPIEDQEAAIDGRAEQEVEERHPRPWRVVPETVSWAALVFDADGGKVGCFITGEGGLDAVPVAEALVQSVNAEGEAADLRSLLAERDALVKAATAMVEAHNNWLWGTDEAERVDEAADHLRALLAPERQVRDE